MACIFCQIASHKVSKKFIYEDSVIMVFPDIHPKNIVHLLIVPKKHVSDFLVLTEDNRGVFMQVCALIQKLIVDTGLRDKGYRLVINGGGARVVQHLHIHLRGPMDKSI